MGSFSGIRTGIAEIRFTGTPTDCNGNNIDDTFEIQSGAAGDCNANGIPNDCDITSVRSSDFNGNGVPDECTTEFFVYNLNDNEFFTILSTALSAADLDSTDRVFLLGGELLQAQTVPADVIALEVFGPLGLSAGLDLSSTLTLSDGCDFDSTGRIDAIGSIILVDYAAIFTALDPVDLTNNASFIARAGSYTFSTSDIDILNGTLVLQGSFYDGDVDIGSVAAVDLSPSTGFVTGFGTFVESIDVYGYGEWLVQADTQSFGNIDLEGRRTAVQNGVLTAFDGIDNFGGSIVGDVALARGSGLTAGPRCTGLSS